MKVKLRKTITEEIETDVEFPIYRKIVFDHGVQYCKIVDEKKEISVYIQDDDDKVEIELDTPSFYGEEEYILGKGDYYLPEYRFYQMIDKAKDIINKIIA